ncbi:MAG: carbon storage regulator CsrA [Phycisphaerales bacterium]|nr:carbon storage regulator CsrA [Phycisphaerales bacterium]
MLVLSRQRDETIMIGDDIEITVVDIRGDKVRLGITAPTRIAVHRKEVYEAIKAENQRASQISGADLSQLPSPGPMKRPRPPGMPPGTKLGAAPITPLPPLSPQQQIRPGDAKTA